MSADRLREAARVLRERAEAATPGPWSAANEHGLLGPDAEPSWYVSRMRPGYESMSPTEGYVGDVAETFSTVRDSDPNAAYIATMHPGVGLTLADWLDVVSGWLDEGLGLIPPYSNIGDAWLDIERQAHRLADLILGAES